MFATKLKGHVTAKRQLVVELPNTVAPGAVEVIVLQDEPPVVVKSRKTKGTAHPAFGLWAKRPETEDSATYAATLRRQIENRHA
jgi:hypothetical protein